MIYFVRVLNYFSFLFQIFNIEIFQFFIKDINN